MIVRYYDLKQQTGSDSIDLLFPGLDPTNEHVVVFSPHDDDAILGAGYLICALQEIGCPVTILIFCDGRAGYSTPAEGSRRFASQERVIEDSARHCRWRRIGNCCAGLRNRGERPVGGSLV